MSSQYFGKMHLSSLLRIQRLMKCQKVQIRNMHSATRSRSSSLLKNRAGSCSRGFPTQFNTYGTGLAQTQHSAITPVNSLVDISSLFCNHIRNFSCSGLRFGKEEITVNFLNRDGETFTVKAKVGETLLDTVIDNDVDIDGFGACEGTLACSTCHLLFDDEIFEMLPEKLDEEEDMLDLAYGLEDNSRLGCQISLTKEMDNMVVKVPEGINDARDV